MKRVKESAQPIGGINIAPVINVAFVLVIVMLMTAPILNIPNMQVNLPDAVTTEAKEANIAISMALDGRVSVDEKIVSWDNLPGELNRKLKRNKNIMVIIRADKDCMYTDVENLIDMIKHKTYAKRISVATRQRTEKLVE
ncbi:MAG: hypothetical protein GF384_09200 [Elusimicrobia bacterium]|nr:hypothetical protein [Elusimicrobiota bacterium]MBD3412760.1 hypothetical protein [Elusimicrobiota bacterium]